MPMYSVTDLQHDKTVSVYTLPSCDFKSVIDMLGDFAEENSLDTCYLVIRDYADDEIREKTPSPATLAYEQKIKEAKDKGKSPKRYRKPTLKPVDPDTGTAHVVSFDWLVHKPDIAKQIRFSFYDDGWPGSITVSKTPSALLPTEIVIECVNRPNNLQEKFKVLIENAEIPTSSV